MIYVIANIEKANFYGFKSIFHFTNDSLIMLNEVEVNRNTLMEGAFDQRVSDLNGTKLSKDLMKFVLSQGKFKYNK